MPFLNEMTLNPIFGSRKPGREKEREERKKEVKEGYWFQNPRSMIQNIEVSFAAFQKLRLNQCVLKQISVSVSEILKYIRETKLDNQNYDFMPIRVVEMFWKHVFMMQISNLCTDITREGGNTESKIMKIRQVHHSLETYR